MSEEIQVDVCVIGAGSGGLSVAYVASQLGLNTVLIEGHKMGGDCLNYGCVPSKAILAAAHAAENQRQSAPFGVKESDPAIDFAKVHDHVHGIIADIAPHDSVERYESLGAKVILARAEFIAHDRVAAGEFTITSRRFVIATGSRPHVPLIPGLDDVPYLTNETIFDKRETPAHLIVLGAGPIGAELSQAFRRLGAKVTVLQRSGFLRRDDPDLAKIVQSRLEAEGVVVREGMSVERVETDGGEIAISVRNSNGMETITGSDVLVAAGRVPNIDALGLEKARVNFGEKGVVVDHRLRTSNRRIYAIGDVTGGPLFTHAASYHAGIVVRNAFFRLPAKVDYSAFPRVTYTDPELASVGLSEAEARRADTAIRVLNWSFCENDRARTERQTEGMVKVVTSDRGRIMGAAIVGASAGDLIQPWVLAITRKLPIRAMADIIAPYPTLSEANKRAAGSFFTEALFSHRTRRLVRFLSRLG